MKIIPTSMIRSNKGLQSPVYVLLICVRKEPMQLLSVKNGSVINSRRRFLEKAITPQLLKKPCLLWNLKFHCHVYNCPPTMKYSVTFCNKPFFYHNC
jgi:hypothetical protein